MITREYLDGDEEAIVRLLDTVFEGWPKIDIPVDPVDFWRWKYLDGPLPGCVYLIEEDGEIIASHHNWRQKVRVQGQTYTVNEGMDFTVHPDYRGKGVSKKVSELARQTAVKNDVPLCYVITENPIILRSHDKRSNVKSFPKRLVNLTRVKDISIQLKEMPVKNSWLVNIGYRLLSGVNSIRNHFRNRPINENIVIERVQVFPESINSYWDMVKEELDFSVEVSDEYLNWRYCDPRTGGYITLLAREKESIWGYIVLRVNRTVKDYPIGYIVDLSYIPGRRDVGYRLIEQGIKYIDGVNTVNYLTVEGHPDTELFSLLGFLDSRVKLHVNYEIYSHEDLLAGLHDVSPEKIHVTWGNFDILPVKMPKN